MADDTPTGPAELGAEMNYEEHEKTYDLFLGLTKYGTLVTVAILLAMTAGFFWGFGFISSTILFILLCVVGAFILR